jgi:hypothetical protein
VISIGLPDADSVQRLIRRYSSGHLAAHEPLDTIGNELAGWTPAVIREVVDRSKLTMIGEDRNEIIEDDLLVSVRGMKNHLDLLAPKVAEVSVPEAYGMATMKLMEMALGGEHAVDSSDMEAVNSTMKEVYGTVRRGFAEVFVKQKEAIMAAKTAGTNLERVKIITAETHKIVKENLDN